MSRGRSTCALSLVSAVSLCGCAAVFRDSKVRVHVDSDPSGAEIVYDERAIGRTPSDPELERSSSTALRITKPGYQDHRGAVHKHLNAGWAVADVATCVIPIALCIPLLVDAISGAWMDLDEDYRVRLDPLAPSALAPGAPPAASVPPPLPSGTPTAPPPGQIDL
jgi:hypothetical protein